ncbi:hypothetical protein IWW36_002206 [Coemansia brasiliensis]|uniref:SEC7 domain-containing protein n=1 Tax=Coemansia brasiliensis TaxID=2650707 RepID=A0A9W8M187_9FUNG|nr:hypothetical protein IWW36_002206 [Coemansia brasiliensis]
MSYHGAYEGVPIVGKDPTALKALKPQRSKSSGDTASELSQPQKPEKDTSHLLTKTEPVISNTIESADRAHAFDQPHPETLLSQMVSMTVDKDGRHIAVADPMRTQTSRSYTRDKTESISRPQSRQRPLTSAQTMQARPLTEWRDIHVKSLNRVDSILREAVGLSQAFPNRWSVYTSVGTQAQTDHSGLGILLSRQQEGIELKQRPGTAHGQYGVQSQSRQTHNAPTPYTLGDTSLLQPFASPVAERSSSHNMARPSTSNARLGSSAQFSIAEAAPALRQNPELGPLARHREGGNRVTSMYIPSQRTSYGVQRQISMCSRPIHLSRDESRRSRLFAEYEQLVAAKDSDEGDDEAQGPLSQDETSDEESGQGNSVEAEAPLEKDGISFVKPGKGLENISEEAEEGFSSYEDVVETLRTSRESPRGKRTSMYVDSPRPGTAHIGADAMQKRNLRTLSVQADLFSKQKTEQRWSRIISQNQHLFGTQVPESPEDTKEARLLATEKGQSSNDKPFRTLATQSLVLDLPNSVDLFQDVTQALAERLPPLSAGSTASTASTVTQRHDSAILASKPLSAMPRPQSAASSQAGSKQAHAADQQRRPSTGHVASNKRESIYIDPDSLFNSALFTDEEFLYQHEKAQQSTGYTPTIAAASLPEDKAYVEQVKEHQPELPASESSMPTTESRHSNSSNSDLELASPDSCLPIPATPESQQSCAENNAVETTERTMRHSEYVREQLRLVEGATPATALGAELSKNDEEHRELLAAYMKRFDFCEQPVDIALRQLFREFSLPSESQQIDRVITSFSQRYHACNPGLFFSAEIVYAYAFAILLLHTDAHNPRVRNKMTKAQFTTHAKLLDDSAVGQNEMFDEILDIIYDNVTMVKFEYAPSGAGAETLSGLHSPNEKNDGARGTASGHLGLLEGAREQSPGISGWLRRMFAPASASSACKTTLSPQDIPSKEQYSYSTVGRRRVGSITGINGPASPVWAGGQTYASRPSTAHGTFPRSYSSGSNPASGSLDTAHVELLETGALARGRANTSGPCASSTPVLSPIRTSFSQPCASSSPPGSQLSSENFAATREMLRGGAVARPFRSSPLAGGRGQASAGSSPEHEAQSPEPESPGSPQNLATPSGFTMSDVAVRSQPLMVESIRLKGGVKSHVKRRVSLRRGRPLSGIIGASADGSPQQPSGNNSSTSSGSALLRVDMAGHVSRKMERLDHGRRGLVRRWKGFWMVLSGSRLYMFRASDGGHEADPGRGAMAVQTIISLRNGVAVVDAGYKKYPHVFRILADDGSEMLVKAPDDDAVAEWMARINCAAAFKSMGVERRTLEASDASGSRAQQLEERLESLEGKLEAIDDQLEHRLRLFKQLASMVPLTRQGRAKTIQFGEAVRQQLTRLYVDEQRLTCYKDVLELDLAIEYELLQPVQ